MPVYTYFLLGFFIVKMQFFTILSIKPIYPNKTIGLTHIKVINNSIVWEQGLLWSIRLNNIKGNEEKQITFDINLCGNYLILKMIVLCYATKS